MGAVTLASCEKKRLISLGTSHPVYGCELGTYIRSKFSISGSKTIPKPTGDHEGSQKSKSSYSSFLDASRATSTKVSSHPFFHADLILKRDSKSEGSLVVDMAQSGFPVSLSSFLLSTVDVNLVQSRLHVASDCIVLPNLSESVSNSEIIHSTCMRCSTDFCSPSNAKFIACPSCDSLAIPKTRSSNFDPNRRYFGPVVPDYTNTWIGVTESLVHKNTRVGILHATMYNLTSPTPGVHKLPSPHPRLQWVIYPLV
jgi:DNA-directed RNA polymerase subunit RPC12/RpoP